MSTPNNLDRQYRQSVAQAKCLPTDATAAFNHGWWAARIGRFVEAISAYERAIALNLEGAEEAMTNIASIYSERLGRDDRALEWLACALAVNPGYYPAVFNRAHLAEQLGDRSGALAGFEHALSLKPGDTLALARLAEALPEVSENHKVVARLRQAAKGGDPDVLLSLAKVEERLANLGAAWSAMVAANGVDAKRLRPWPSDVVRARNIDQLKPEPAVAKKEDAPASGLIEGPVFIVGMFRTGSTLLEQILAAHPRFSPLGESEYWPRQISALGGGMVIPGQVPGADALPMLREGFYQHCIERGLSGDRRVTDKRPDNLFHLPTIAAAIPEARFLITRRDWRDVLLSVFGTRLHPQHGYAVDPVKIRQHLRLCAEISDFCEENWPDRVRVVDYESVIAAPVDTLKALFEWLGEAWDPGCLDFHQLDNGVRTASVWQVREPLNKSRSGRWRQYEQPLREIFGDGLDQAHP